MSLQNDIEHVLNSHCAEHESDTPDFVLAHFLYGCLEVFNQTVNMRANWNSLHDRKYVESVLPDRSIQFGTIDNEEITTETLKMRKAERNIEVLSKQCSDFEGRIAALENALAEQKIQREKKWGNR